MKSNIIFAVVLLALLLGSGALLVSRVSGSFNPQFSFDISSVFDDVKEYFSRIKSRLDTKEEYVVNESVIYEEVIINSSPSPLPTATNSQPVKPCYRYTVTHLDGSTSNLCYSQADYGALVSLGVQFKSAKTFYQFHLDGVARYQAEYDKTGSSIYLDAKASSQAQADSQKQAMDSLIGQMQVIEDRGY